MLVNTRPHTDLLLQTELIYAHVARPIARQVSDSVGIETPLYNRLQNHSRPANCNDIIYSARYSSKRRSDIC